LQKAIVDNQFLDSDENIKIIGRKTTLAEEDKSLDSEAIALDQFEQGSNVNEKYYTSEVVTIGKS